MKTIPKAIRLVPKEVTTANLTIFCPFNQIILFLPDWSDDELTAQALIFLIAGFDTTSTLLMFLAYELALNPEVQECLQEEIDSIFNADGDEGLTYEKLAKATYMDMVISGKWIKDNGHFWS